MTRDDIRTQLHQILDAHDQLLAAIRSGHDGMRQTSSALQQAHAAMQQAFDAQDAVLVSAIQANRAALVLLNRIQDEGVNP
jgi:hypothetical protein